MVIHPKRVSCEGLRQKPNQPNASKIAATRHEEAAPCWTEYPERHAGKKHRILIFAGTQKSSLYCCIRVACRIDFLQAPQKKKARTSHVVPSVDARRPQQAHRWNITDPTSPYPRFLTASSDRGSPELRRHLPFRIREHRENNQTHCTYGTRKDIPRQHIYIYVCIPTLCLKYSTCSRLVRKQQYHSTIEGLNNSENHQTRYTINKKNTTIRSAMCHVFRDFVLLCGEARAKGYGIVVCSTGKRNGLRYPQHNMIVSNGSTYPGYR